MKTFLKCVFVILINLLLKVSLHKSKTHFILKTNFLVYSSCYTKSCCTISCLVNKQIYLDSASFRLYDFILDWMPQKNTWRLKNEKMLEGWEMWIYQQGFRNWLVLDNLIIGIFLHLSLANVHF